MFIIRLFGVICAQACLYFKRHSRDNTQVKCVVSMISQPLAQNMLRFAGYRISVKQSSIAFY